MVLLYCGRVGRRRVFIYEKAHPSKDGLSRFYYIIFFPASSAFCEIARDCVIFTECSKKIIYNQHTRNG